MAGDVEGTPFGRYRLIGLLGVGGMGEVWRAHDTGTDRMVAIKLLPANFAQNPEFNQRFRREALAAARLNTPHVIPIYDYGEIDGRLYVCMRLIEGRDLQAVLADGPLELSRAVRIVEQVAVALHAAHKVDLLHRDVKPSNILLDENDFAYLIDFGIARAADETRLTKTGNTIGTFAYIAPERLGTRTEEDARADIYSLACVLYECLTGRPPFDEDTMARLVVAHLSTPPPQPSTSRPGMPTQLDEVVATGMAKDPDQRYPTTVELADAARDAITEPVARSIPVAAQPPTVPVTGPVRAPTVGPDERYQPPPSPRVSAPSQRRPEPVTVVAQFSSPGMAAPQVRGAGPPTPTRASGITGRTKMALIVGTVVIVAAVIALVTVIVSNGHRQPSASGSQTTQPGPSTQTVLPFTGLDHPGGVAVDGTGAVYVTEFKRVFKLAAGSTAPTELQITDLSSPDGVAVDGTGTVYVADQLHNRVLKLAAGSAEQTVLPFTGLNVPYGVAVDGTGTVYVGDSFNNRVVKLAAGSTAQTELPFTGLNYPTGVAVDGTGTVYVTDSSHNRVVKLAAGSTAQSVLPFTGLNNPAGVAVDGAGAAYVTDFVNDRVVKLAAGSTAQTVLPFTGLHNPQGVAVDGTGTVYVSDRDNNRVVEVQQR